MSFRTAAFAAGAAAVALAVPISTASAATKTVDMGVPVSAQKAWQKLGADANDFFPHTTTIHVGDKVKFVPTGFHTVDLPAKGGKMLPLISPTSTAANATDAGGAPLWFNGQPQLTFTPDLVTSSLFGKSATYDGTKRVETGAPVTGHPKPASVTFTKAGTYTYFCNVHAGMKGVLKVLPKSKAVPTAAADAKALKQQLATAATIAKGLSSTKPAANTMSVGAAGAHGVELFALLPAAQTVPVGTTMTFAMSPKSVDVHTATTGPGDPEKEPASYLGKLAQSFQGAGPFDPLATYPSEQPGTAAGLTPTYHGNGFWNSGVLDNSSATPLPNKSAVRFDAPGTYQFYCLIHPFMHATVTVQ